MPDAKLITETTIRSYLDEISSNQWKLFRSQTDNSWRLIYHSLNIDKSCNLFLSFTEKWMYFQVSLFKVNSQISAECCTNLYSTLLGLNNEIHFCKFSLDARSELLLSIEIPCECFDFSIFRNAIEGLQLYLDRYYTELYQIAYTNDYKRTNDATKESFPKNKDNISWITKPTIEMFMNKIMKSGWKQYSIPTLEEWHLIYRSYRAEFNVFINFTEEWVYFQVPLLKSGKFIHPASRDSLYEYLLKLNNTVYLGKFALGSAGEILLVIELPADSFNFMIFQNAIQSLENYLEKYFAEISIIAQQPEFADFVKYDNFTCLIEENLEIKLL